MRPTDRPTDLTCHFHLLAWMPPCSVGLSAGGINGGRKASSGLLVGAALVVDCGTRRSRERRKRKRRGGNAMLRTVHTWDWPTRSNGLAFLFLPPSALVGEFWSPSRTELEGGGGKRGRSSIATEAENTLSSFLPSTFLSTKVGESAVGGCGAFPLPHPVAVCLAPWMANSQRGEGR